jgi:dTDP-4-dehydrorhamnose reductase
MVKVLITGASGWLGQFLCQRLAGEHEVFGTYNREPAPEWAGAAGVTMLRVDLLDENLITLAISTARPEVVVHLAAITSPGMCEKEVELSMRVNSPAVLLESLRILSPTCTVIFTSTDLVYDGERAPYSPDTDISAANPPVNMYGASKLACERLMLGYPRAVVLRLSNMIGPPCAFKHTGVKFLEWLHGAYLKREYVGLRSDELRSFVYVQDVVSVVAVIVTAVANRSSGAAADVELDSIIGRVLNVGGPRGMSRLELGELLVDCMEPSSGSSLFVGESLLLRAYSNSLMLHS